ncbi:hypothetical protein FOMPIDRAFT_144738 [Fomitopsis schrenkii]|uniref:Uncharacterized protein n=1 Tax=Fomitopsis schrenkii TaxID=2126942 RepID=S8EF54_FOMSC|nr:hypothetical protein FOMPIDRAFT_144738 [Fomitopsis schrenkii]
MADSSDATANSLGLDLDALKIKDDPESSGSAEPPKEDKTSPEPKSTEASNPEDSEKAEEETAGDDEARSPTSEEKREPREKKKPYVNPERVKTGGAQRDKLSEEELATRMARIREQNEKIKQRRLDVKADEDAFKKTQEVDRVKAAKTKKVQENIDRTREQNARRKMEKIQNREWDAGKPTRDWKRKPEENEEASKTPRPSVGIRGAVRGGGAGRGRGRGKAPSSPAPEKTENETETETQWPTEADSEWPTSTADADAEAAAAAWPA